MQIMNIGSGSHHWPHTHTETFIQTLCLQGLIRLVMMERLALRTIVFALLTAIAQVSDSQILSQLPSRFVCLF